MQHFHTVFCEGSGILVILATNGHLWIAPDRSFLEAETEEKQRQGQQGGEGEASSGSAASAPCTVRR